MEQAKDIFGMENFPNSIHFAYYDSLQIKFLQDGRFTTLQGDRDMLPETAQLHHIRRMMDINALAEIYSMQMVQQDTQNFSLLELPKDMEPELVKLLQNYSIVFSQPCGLPPTRSHDHSIPLLEGSNPVKSKGRNRKIGGRHVKRRHCPAKQQPFFISDYFSQEEGWHMEVDELIDELYGAHYFSKLDLRSGYHQILLKPEDRHKTAFRTHQGLYEWLVMPFGLSNAPTTFQSLMNQIFKGVLRRFVLVFFDDILVYSSSWKDHLYHLEVVLRILKQNQLFAKFSKCSFGVQKIGYLGHTLAGNGITMETEKLEAELKLALTTAPVLAIPNFEEPFVLETDASGLGIGAILSQNKHPIAYFSKKLSLRMQKQSAYTREFYAITESLSKFKHFLLGHRFIIKTDQKSLKELLEQTLQTPKQQQWLPKFIGFDFTIQYSPGKENTPADALSRTFAMAWSEPRNTWLQSVAEATRNDEELMKIFLECKNSSGKKGDYVIQQDILMWKGRIMLPNHAKLINRIIGEFHGSKIGGHAGTTRTLARLSAQFFGPKMRKDIRRFPLPIPNLIWEDIAMDFIVSLPISQGYSNIMVVIDRLSKFAHFIPLKQGFNSKTVAGTFIQHIVKLYGFPKSIVSDWDRVFISNFWKLLFKYQGTTLTMSSSYHPQSDGQTENLNRTLEMYLRCFVFDHPKKWLEMLPWAQFWYNTSFHHSIGMSPYQAVYGKLPPTLLKYEHSDTDPVDLQESLKNRDVLLKKLKAKLHHLQNYMKGQADKKRKDVSLEVGDLVLVKLQPYINNRLRYFGPFKVLEKIGKVAYKLLLPDSAKIHPVFHISVLKKFHGNPKQLYFPLPLTITEVNRKGREVTEVLIQWDSFYEANHSWETMEEVQKAYPHFNLEDKVAVEDGSIVTRIKHDNIKGEEKVTPSGHVSNKDEGMGVRRGTRERKENTKWRDFIQNNSRWYGPSLSAITFLQILLL
ncbi:hypothetical protein V8G54_019925 [Vigna mungo]|uniref:Uncharacterized protein n=1 Tax=Vigna mungo TaxID=3915 RepID=A0AAQ3RSV3_VIGMU